MDKQHGSWWQRLWARSPAPEGVGERRAAERFACTLVTRCKPVNRADENTWRARFRDISLSGISLVVKRRFEAGTLLHVDISGAVGDAPSDLWARVVHVRAERGGVWLLGCALARHLGEDELRALLATPDKACQITEQVEPVGE